MGIINTLGSAVGLGRYNVDEEAAKIPGYDGMQQQAQQGAQAAGQRQAAQLDGSQGEFRQGQSGLAAALAAQASGQGPSLAQGQLKQATDRNLAQALALQASQRGMGAASGLRDVANQRAAISQQAAADAGTLRLQEQGQAQNTLAQVLAGARGQDVAVASENARLQQQQTQLNDSLVQFYVQQGMTLAMAQQQANMQLQGLKAGAFNAQQGNMMQGAQAIARGAGGAASLGATAKPAVGG